MPPRPPDWCSAPTSSATHPGICELILLLFGSDQMLVQAVVKIVLGTVGNILGFVANVLGLVDS